MGRCLVAVVLLVGASACGAGGGGGIHQFAQYTVDLQVTDQPDLNTSAPSRELMFLFDGDSRQVRASRSIRRTGPWSRGPTRTAPHAT